MRLLDRVAGHPAGAVAFVDGAESVTWAEVRQRADDIRTFLIERGVQPGDRVAVAASSELSFVPAIIGAFGAGAIVVPTNPLSPEPELRRMLGPLEPRVILASPMAQGMLAYGATPADIVPIASIQSAATPAAFVSRALTDTAVLMMTSGTSGPAKAAMLSHANIDWAIRMASTGNPAGMNPCDTVLCALPTAHVFGLMLICTVIEQGATGVLLPRFETEASLDRIAEHNVTLLAGAPLMWNRWAHQEGDPARLSSVTRAISGAAALPLEVFATVKERFGIEVCEGYGLTETSALTTTSLGTGHVKPTSVGQPMDGVTIQLVEANGAPVELGDTGEIVIHSPGVFQGYWKDQAATDQVRTADGWLWTGDAGAFDNDGNLFIVDRLKDVIIVSGFNVYPAEVEEVLREHEAVTGVAVVGATHLERGETVVAYVTGTADEASIRAFAEQQLASYKRPTEYHFVDELPITMTGKVKKRELR